MYSERLLIRPERRSSEGWWNYRGSFKSEHQSDSASRRMVPKAKKKRLNLGKFCII